jgi:hypothetical protein
MILDCHVHLPSPGLNQTWEWEPCTVDFDAETKAKILGGNLHRLLTEHGWEM